MCTQHARKGSSARKICDKDVKVVLMVLCIVTPCTAFQNFLHS